MLCGSLHPWHIEKHFTCKKMWEWTTALKAPSHCNPCAILGLERWRVKYGEIFAHGDKSTGCPF